MTSLLLRAWGALVERLVRRGALARARFFVEKMRPYLVPNERVLDVGSGTGHISIVLQTECGQRPHMLDVPPKWRTVAQWLLAVPCARVLGRRYLVPYSIYSGEVLPIQSSSFDVVLLAFSLHHAENPETVLCEAVRVGRRRIIIFEDIPHDEREARLNHFADALVNLEVGHPHGNRSREDWHRLFQILGLRVIHEESFTSHLLGLPFPNTMFVLDKP